MFSIKQLEGEDSIAKVIHHILEGDKAREHSDPLLPRIVQRHLLDVLLTALSQPGEVSFMILSYKNTCTSKDFPTISLHVFP